MLPHFLFAVFEKKKKRSRFSFLIIRSFFQNPFFSPSFFSLRLCRRQLRAQSPWRGRRVAVEAQGDRVVPFPHLEQGRVEGREQKLRRRRHEDAADARGGEAVAREQGVEGPLVALEVEGPHQQRLLQVRRRRGEQLLVPFRDRDAVGEREGLLCDRAGERRLVGQILRRAGRRLGVDRRGRHERKDRLVVEAADCLVEGHRLGRGHAGLVVGPHPHDDEVGETRRWSLVRRGERALGAASREVGEGGVGDDVDGDLRDLEV